ncbi:hypothetical protein CBL_04578 [Carabus blaptoides fortunei]
MVMVVVVFGWSCVPAALLRLSYALNVTRFPMEKAKTAIKSFETTDLGGPPPYHWPNVQVSRRGEPGGGGYNKHIECMICERVAPEGRQEVALDTGPNGRSSRTKCSVKLQDSFWFNEHSGYWLVVLRCTTDQYLHYSWKLRKCTPFYMCVSLKDNNNCCSEIFP